LTVHILTFKGGACLTSLTAVDHLLIGVKDRWNHTVRNKLRNPLFFLLDIGRISSEEGKYLLLWGRTKIECSRIYSWESGRSTNYNCSGFSPLPPQLLL
jgi:hypothetical protein